MTEVTNANLENFFKNSEVKIVSDLEGNSLASYLDDKNPNMKILINGDMLDSTGFVPAVHEKQTFNLLNIHMVLSNPDKYSLILGNRDLNKFKCKFMCHLENPSETDDIVNSFNNGNICYDFESYELLKNKLIVSKTNIWKCNTQNWYTFWANFLLPTETPPEKNPPKEWHVQDKNDNDLIFLNRFKTIFGKDNVTGTMSADNLLHTIPKELGVCIADDNQHEKKDLNNDYRAFIVLAIFKSMCMKIDIQYNTHALNSVSTFKGWLYRLYKADNVYFTGYYKQDVGSSKYLHLFSHGGITKSLMDESESVLMDFLTNNKDTTDKMKNINHKKQAGGLFKTIDVDCKNTVDICKKIDTINTYYKNITTKVFNETEIAEPTSYTEPTDESLFMLATSAPFDANKFAKKFDITDVHNAPSFVLNSPIQPGIELMRDNMFCCDDAILVQVVGHKPKGYTASVDFFEKGNVKSFVVSLDISNSLVNKPMNDGSQAMMIYKENEVPKINSYIKLNVKDEDGKKYGAKFPSEITEIKSNKSTKVVPYFISDTIEKNEGKYDIQKGVTVNISLDDDLEYLQKMTFESKENGKANREAYYGGHVNGNHYITYLLDGDNPPFRSTLLILNETDFDNFNDNMTNPPDAEVDMPPLPPTAAEEAKAEENGDKKANKDGDVEQLEQLEQLGGASIYYQKLTKYRTKLNDNQMSHGYEQRNISYKKKIEKYESILRGLN